MPSGREIHTIKPYQPPVLDRETLETMRAPPDQTEDVGDASSDDEIWVQGSTSTSGGGSYY